MHTPVTPTPPDWLCDVATVGFFGPAGPATRAGEGGARGRQEICLAPPGHPGATRAGNDNVPAAGCGALLPGSALSEPGYAGEPGSLRRAVLMNRQAVAIHQANLLRLRCTAAKMMASRAALADAVSEAARLVAQARREATFRRSDE